MVHEKAQIYFEELILKNLILLPAGNGIVFSCYFALISTLRFPGELGGSARYGYRNNC